MNKGKHGQEIVISFSRNDLVNSRIEEVRQEKQTEASSRRIFKARLSLGLFDIKGKD